MKIPLAVGVLLTVLLPATLRCEDIKPKAELTVFAAASLTESFNEIGKQFEEKHPNATVVFNFGASNQLRFQIEQGARADVFASANSKEMDALVKSGAVSNDTVRTFSRNRLVVLYPKENPGKIAALEDLAKPNLKLIVAHKAVPVGNYTLEMLGKMSADAKYGDTFKERVLKNVVSEEENVKSVVAKVRLGQADAGIAYVSDVGSAAKDVGTLDIKDPFNPIAIYTISPLKKAPQLELAREFVEHVLSNSGQEIIRKNGFMPANDKKKE